NVWRQCRVEIDYKNGITYLEHSEGQPKDQFDHVGLILRWSPRGYLIDGIAKNADPATLAAVHPGDLLLRVDELDTAGAPLARVVDALRGEPGEEHAIVIERAGKTEEIGVKVARVL